MGRPELTRLELQILEAFWERGNASIREVQQAFPAPRPAYTTIQTTVYRMESRGVLRRIRKVSNAHIFEPTISRDSAQHRLLDEFLSFFGGKAQPMMAKLAEAGRLTLDDVRDLERTIRRVQREKKEERRKR